MKSGLTPDVYWSATPILAANTAASDFTAEDLVPGDLNRLRRGLVRLILNQLCRRLTERLDSSPTPKP